MRHVTDEVLAGIESRDERRFVTRQVTGVRLGLPPTLMRLCSGARADRIAADARAHGISEEAALRELTELSALTTPRASSAFDCP
jgi:hypothetical protein